MEIRDKKLIKTLKDIEKAIILMKKHKVSEIKIDNVTLKINSFEPPQTFKKEKEIAQEGDDELLFWSAQQ